MLHFRADLFHIPERGQIERISDALVTVDAEGMITWVAPYSAAETRTDTIDLRGLGVLIPG